MHVEFDKKGKISVLPPKSKAGESTTFKAEMDLIIALTACSSGQSNNFNYKPILGVIDLRQNDTNTNSL
jgi:uncharacterized protein YcgI (DUF1989 family)